MTYIQRITSRIQYLFILLFLASPVAVQAQDAPVAPAIQSHTSGLFLHARTGGHGMAFDGPADAEGGGLGLRVGYGFSDRFTVYLGVEGAGFDGGRGFEGLGEDEEYGAVYVELGSRYHFRRGKRLVPYADAALAVVGLGYNGTGPFAGEDVTYGGAGLSMGGGVLYFFTPKIALDSGIAFTPGSLREQSIDGTRNDVNIGMAGARIHVGISFYPFR